MYARRAFRSRYTLILKGNFLEVVKLTCDLVWRQQQITFIQITAKQFRYNSSFAFIWSLAKFCKQICVNNNEIKTIFACLNCCHKSYVTLCNWILRTRNQKQCGPIHAANYPFFVHRWVHQTLYELLDRVHACLRPLTFYLEALDDSNSDIRTHYLARQSL